MLGRKEFAVDKGFWKAHFSMRAQQEGDGRAVRGLYCEEYLDPFLYTWSRTELKKSSDYLLLSCFCFYYGTELIVD